MIAHELKDAVEQGVIGDLNPEFQLELQQLLGTLSEFKTLPLAHCRKMYQLSKIILNQKHLKFSVTELSAILGLNKRDLLNIRKLGKYFKGNDELFEQKLQELQPVSWEDLKNKLKINKKRPQQAIHVNRTITIIGRMIRAHKDGEADLSIELARLRDLLVKHVGLGYQLQDKNYIQYHQCCGCNADPTPDGHKLQKYKNIVGIWYPMCEECLELGREPIIDNILFMYVSYAIGLERALDAI
jgi:hypothetical protein